MAATQPVEQNIWKVIAIAFSIFLGMTSAAVGGRCGDLLGDEEMSADGMLTVTHEPDAQGYRPPTLFLKPDSSAYQGYIDLVGGIKPGESKPIYRHDSWAIMNGDRTLTVHSVGGNDSGFISEPGRMQITPSDPRYEELLRRVGGLEPGQTKPFPCP